MTRANVVVTTAFAVLLTLLSFLGVSPAVASQSLIVGTAEYADGRVHVSGDVTSEGVPIRHVSVTGHLAGTSAASASDDLGHFAFSLQAPEGVTGSVTLTLVFEGSGEISGTQTTLHVKIPEDHAVQGTALTEEAHTSIPSPTPEVTAPEPEQVGLDVRASLSRTNSYPGGLLELSGAVASSHGNPLGSVQVDASFEGSKLGDSTTFTSEDGHFLTYVEIPAEAAEGGSAIRVSAHAGNGYLPAVTDLPVVIKPVPPLHSPSAEPTVTAAPAHEEAQLAVASDTQAAHDAPATTSTFSESGSRILMAALVLIGGMALLSMIVLALRGRVPGRAATEPSESWLDMFGESSKTPTPGAGQND